MAQALVVSREVSAALRPCSRRGGAPEGVAALQFPWPQLRRFGDAALVEELEVEAEVEVEGGQPDYQARARYFVGL